ncbi:hypothetical protein [Hymenobacter weizhouensis]|uniref:hypothetical protein n=1 Tax=Hymenobacter sp. YIM 151500-1 TaxID=2987689 RepID=UPI00222629BA|nr:hypothetical protein [Hymenobacter sp. YIM 151500-1]UYZ61366.1 hypothetical protein OIS53_10125 [Hymenobacter sp. YIM 151500-1]
MAYSVNALTTTADCDKLLGKAEDDLRALRHRSDNLDYARDTTSESATEAQATLAGLDAEIQALTTVIPTLAEGTKARKNSELDLREATYRRANLADRLDARGPVALLTRERSLAETEARIAEITAFVTAVTARKAAL